MRALAILALALVVVGLAGAASADLTPSQLTVVAADASGAKLKSQGPVHEKGYTAGYQRTFTFAAPNGQSGLVFFQSEALVAPTLARAASEVSSVRSALTQRVGRAAFVASIAQNLKVKPIAIKPGALRSPHVGDSAVELPLSIQLAKRRVYESLLYMQLDRVVSVIVYAGIRPIAAGQSRQLAQAAAAHIDAALTPSLFSKPTVTGLPQVGEVLTAAPGTWSDPTAKAAIQWQRCDATGAACTSIAGATSVSYTPAPEDAGSTLRVEVSATNRFGTAKADSAPTGVVVALVPPVE
jgi:hypothetical protein